MTPPSDPSGPERSDDWTVSLDDESGPPEAALEAPLRLGRWIAAGLAIALVAVAAVIWGPEVDTGEDLPPVPAVLGRHLAVPIALHLPADAVATADGSYVGVQFPAGGAVLVTVPTEVVDPSGARTPMPADPAGWLARHPAIFVSRVKGVTVGGVAATQVDYRRSRMDAPPSRFARLPLFCGWRAEADPAAIDPRPAGPDSTRTAARVCTQITADARVRATFVRIGDRTVLVEAVWRVDDSSATSGGSGTSAVTGLAATSRMPRELQRSYAALLAGLTPASPPTG